MVADTGEGELLMADSDDNANNVSCEVEMVDSGLIVACVDNDDEVVIYVTGEYAAEDTIPGVLITDVDSDVEVERADASKNKAVDTSVVVIVVVKEIAVFNIAVDMDIYFVVDV